MTNTFRVVMLMAATLTACATESNAPLQPCDELGCIDKPSGSSDIWTPCESDVCFCKVNDSQPAEACAIEVVDVAEVQIPVCPVLGCTVPMCNDAGCFCNGLECVPTGIPAPMAVVQ